MRVEDVAGNVCQAIPAVAATRAATRAAGAGAGAGEMMTTGLSSAASWAAPQGLVYSTRHVTNRVLNQEARIHHAFDDVESTMHQPLLLPPPCRGGACGA